MNGNFKFTKEVQNYQGWKMLHQWKLLLKAQALVPHGILVHKSDNFQSFPMQTFGSVKQKKQYCCLM